MLKCTYSISANLSRALCIGRTVFWHTDPAPEIYYVGSGAPAHYHARGKHSFKDDQHRYEARMNDHVANRYQIVEGGYLNSGTFSCVYKAWDYKTKTHVALKIIRNIASMHTEAVQEFNMLKIVHGNPNFIQMHDFFCFRAHHCFTFDLMECDLSTALRASEGFGIIRIRNCAKHIACAISFLHQKRIIHADLKPQNIMILGDRKTSDSVIVADLGSMMPVQDTKHYDIITTIYYRDPAIVLGLNYGLPCDVWSFGCILAELLISRRNCFYPLFRGFDEPDQIKLIQAVLGVPKPEWSLKGKRWKYYFTEEGTPLSTTLTQHGRLGGTKLRRADPGSVSMASAIGLHSDLNQRKAAPKSNQLLDLINACLTWIPQERITIHQAILHPFLLS